VAGPLAPRGGRRVDSPPRGVRRGRNRVARTRRRDFSDWLDATPPPARRCEQVRHTGGRASRGVDPATRSPPRAPGAVWVWPAAIAQWRRPRAADALITPLLAQAGRRRRHSALATLLEARDPARDNLHSICCPRSCGSRTVEQSVEVLRQMAQGITDVYLTPHLRANETVDAPPARHDQAFAALRATRRRNSTASRGAEGAGPTLPVEPIACGASRSAARTTSRGVPGCRRRASPTRSPARDAGLVLVLAHPSATAAARRGGRVLAGPGRACRWMPPPCTRRRRAGSVRDWSQPDSRNPRGETITVTIAPSPESIDFLRALDADPGRALRCAIQAILRTNH
jgi:hypothetical protein